MTAADARTPQENKLLATIRESFLVLVDPFAVHDVNRRAVIISLYEALPLDLRSTIFSDLTEMWKATPEEQELFRDTIRNLETSSVFPDGTYTL